MILAEKLVKNTLPNKSGNPESLKRYCRSPKALQLYTHYYGILLTCFMFLHLLTFSTVL